MSNINDRIKSLRKNLNLSQEAFGNRIGITRASISNIEKGTRNMSEQTLKSICREFNVSSAWLNEGVGDMFNDMDVDLLNKVDEILSGEDEFYKNILRTIVNLSDEDLLLFKRVVDELAGKK